MGGRIDLDSELGRGSRFSFVVQMPIGNALLHKQAAEEDVDLAGLRVLVADDNQVNRMVARAMLERQGCEVTTANDGYEAVMAWKKDEFDIILMDWHMPNLDGVGATLQIRDQEDEGSHIPIIGATANNTVEAKQACREAGMDDYIAKPMRLKRLIEICAQWAPAATRKQRQTG